MPDLKITPLYNYYKSQNAKLIDFGGYLLPVQMTGIKNEHHAVRTAAGIFDVSHMGEFGVEGEGAQQFLQEMVTNDVAKAHPGDALYTAMCYEDGGTVDDLLIYCFDTNHYQLVVNAANIDKDFNWLSEHAPQSINLTNRSEQIALLAVQGPHALNSVQKITDYDLTSIEHFKFAKHVSLNGVDSLVSRTGYTGEDGLELYCPWDQACSIWNALLEKGASDGLIPCGLGARDTLRFEARLPLYGQELSSTISPLEAGIGFAVKTNKPIDFIGKQALITQKTGGLKRKIVGLEMIDRAIPRSHYKVYAGDKEIGEVTTGTQAPTIGKNLGLALLNSEWTKLGTEVDVDVRGKRKKAKIVKTPFYKRS
ncbi:glycine cleavage system aminomethyltransferase GcvT [Sporolactobacillus terrae]|uniref:Aminomethyltransferase n=1 Tax=Sporolactobacillus terrae TaxID=269673 RepID=A0ABX5Q7V2_9BACL|nr:glycine cleavage system aminomethyltransferase GcvT [Sporolactobacillus terrae]QAA22746.1 glycine cleavage system protein T [Sporolactobacillus terrae]QAA25719.1 glycine cleavage system protein T [Sporolactobacillus terrae]UAK17531.1 glycine cleavage system aminomethyltransferase GcvT [Sporolactobacillus terrae]